jgi:hypothetical protein
MPDSDVDMANLPIARCIDNCRNYLFIAGGAVALHQSRERAGAVQTAEDIGHGEGGRACYGHPERSDCVKILNQSFSMKGEQRARILFSIRPEWCRFCSFCG